MSRALCQIVMMRATIMTNTFLYYLKRLWLIGKLVPDRVYGNPDFKIVLAVLFTIVGQVVSLTGKVLYVLVMVVLPTWMMKRVHVDAFDYMVQILFFLSCLMGPLQDSVVFQVTKEKFTCIRYMKMDAQKAVKAVLCYRYIPFALYFLIAVVGGAWFLGGSVWNGICLWLVIVMFRAAGEAFQVWYFDRTGIIFSRRYGWVWIVIGLSLVCAYSCWAVDPFVRAAWLFHPICLVLICGMGIVSIWYLMAGYQGYRQKLHRTMEEKWMLSSIMKQSGQESIEKEVGVRERDLKVNTSRMAGIKKLHGYAYFNALFFLRHERQIKRPMYYRLAVVGICFLGGVTLRIFSPEAAYLAGINLPEFLPLLVFIMYMMTVADKACKVMFYNCDKSMLRFGFYRNPKTLLSMFRIRLIQVAKYNMMIGAAICAAVVVFRMVCGIWEFDGNMALFCLAVLVLSVFFTVHHLFLYYVFQPYSEEMNVKNPFFWAFNMVIYAVCFFCYEIQTGGVFFTMDVLAVTTAYIIVALMLVYRFAPKMFRVK